MSRITYILEREEFKCMISKGKEWRVIDYSINTRFILDDKDIDIFVMANHLRFKHSIIKREYIDLLHASDKKDAFAVFKEIFIVEGGKLYKLFIDYHGCYGYYECEQHGWTNRLICYGN